MIIWGFIHVVGISTVLSSNAKSGCPCLVASLKRKVFRSSPLCLKLAVGALFQVEKNPGCSSLLRILIISGCWILLNVFLHLSRWSFGFSPLFCSVGGEEVIERMWPLVDSQVGPGQSGALCPLAVLECMFCLSFPQWVLFQACSFETVRWCWDHWMLYFIEPH